MMELDTGTILYLSNKEVEGILPKVIRVYKSYEDWKYFKCGEIKDDFFNNVREPDKLYDSSSDYEITIDQETMFKYYTAITPTSTIEIVKNKEKGNYYIYIHNNKNICFMNADRISDYLQHFDWDWDGLKTYFLNSRSENLVEIFDRNPYVARFIDTVTKRFDTVNKMNVYKNDNVSNLEKLTEGKYFSEDTNSEINMGRIILFLMYNQNINMKFFDRILLDADFGQDPSIFMKSIYNIEIMVNSYWRRLSVNDIDANSVYIIRYKRTTSIENLKKYMKRDRIVLAMDIESCNLYVVGYNYDYSKNLMDSISNGSAMSKDEISKFLSDKTSK